MKFHIEKAHSGIVAGWIFDERHNAPVSLQIWQNDKLLAAAKATALRPDVGAAHPDAPHSISSGFVIDLPECDGPFEIKALSKNHSTTIYRKGRRPTYQTFENEAGDSNSPAKLLTLGLPDDLTGKSVLDLGCNEGFFCREALRRGARRVVGIDSNAEIIERAKLRVPGARFLHKTWWNIPFERFDYILFLSAIHYEKQQRQLLGHLRNFLTEEGTLILECGAIPDRQGKRTHLIDRHDGYFVFPTYRQLVEDLLTDYAVRERGPSVNQDGDPVPRIVFHCKNFQPTIIAVSGGGGTGKSVLCREFSKNGIHVIGMDSFYSEITTRSGAANSRAVQYIKDNFLPTRVDTFVRKAIEDGMAKELNKLVISCISKSDRLTVVEGFQFGIPEYMSSFKSLAVNSGYRVQTMQLSI